ncbi:uncharacterized protein LOC143253755 isoform X2 [Tachypleus tridentatus]|uniref:uncharacterized protein LOC143253755 isoform X2 n=1 Tax=Tachypleus tridentatus TaxID=6853 RepID=UPI003FCF4BCF
MQRKKMPKKHLEKEKTSKKYGVRKITLRSNSRMPKDLKLTEHLIMCIKEKCKSQLSAVKPVYQEDSRYTCKEKERVSLPQLKLQAPLINNCSEQKLNNKIDESDICNNKQLELFGGNKKSFGFHYIADHNYTMIAENKIMENKFSFQKVAAKTNVEEQNLHTRLEEMEEVYEEPFITEQLELMDDYVLLEKQSDLYAEQVNKVETTDRNGKQNISGEIIQVCIRKLKQETDINHETKNVNGEWKNQSLKMECHKASRLLKQFDSKRSELFLETLNEEKEENNFQNNYEEALHTSQLEKVKRNLKSVKGNEKRCEMHTQFSCEELKGVKKHENDLLAKFKSPKLLMEEHKINKNISFRKQTEKHPELTQQLNVPENKQEGETCLFSENNQGHFEGIIDSESEFKRSQANVLQFSEKQWQDLKDTVKSKLEIRLKDAVKLHVEEAYMDNQETVKQAVRQQIKNNGTEDMTYLNIKGTFTHEREKDCRSKRPIYKNYLKSKNLKQNEREQRPKKKIKISEEITMHDDSCQIVENKKITFTHKQENLHEGNLGNFIKVKDVRQNMKINSAQKTSWMKLKHSYKGEKGKNLMEELNKNVQPNLNTSTQQDGTSKIKDIFLLNNNKSLNSENDNQNCESKEIDLNKIYLELQNELKDETEKYYYKTTQMQKCRKVQDDQLATDGKKSDNCYKKLKKRKSTTGQNRFKNKIKKLDCSIEELPGNSYRKVKHDSEPTVMHDRRLKKSGTKKSENLIKCWENAEKTTAKVDDQRDDKTSDSVLYANKSEVKYRKYRDHQNKTQNEKWIDSCEKLSYVPLYDVRSLTGTFKAKNLKLNETKNIFSESTDVKFPLKSNPIRSKRNRRPPQCLCCSHATYEDLVKEFKSSQSPACPRIKSGEVNKVCYASPHKKMSLTEQCNICKMCFPNFAELLEHVITKERNVPVSACISDQHIETTHENKTCGPLDFAYSKLSIIHNKEAITSVAGNVLTLEKNKEAITPVPGNVLNLKKNNEAINSVPGNVLKLEKNNEEISLSGNVLKLGQDNEEIVCMPGNVLKLEQNNEAINYVPGNMLKQEQNNEEISVPGNVIKPEQDSECFVITEIKIPITPVSLHCSKGKDYDSAHDNSDEGTHNNIQNPLIEGYRKPPVFFSSISQNEQMFCESKTSEFVKHSESNRLSGSVQLNCTQAERANLKSPVSMNETDDSVPFSVFEIHPGPQVSPDVDTPLTDISHKSEVQSTPSHSSKSPFLSEGHDNPQYEVLRHEEFEEGCKAACNGPYDGKWSKTMVGFGPEDNHFVAELTYNYGINQYQLGNDFLGITIKSQTAIENAKNLNWPIKEDNNCFVIEAPGGYKFFLINDSQPQEKDPVQKVTLASSNLKKSLDFWHGLLDMKIYSQEEKTAVLGYGDNQDGHEICFVGNEAFCELSKVDPKAEQLLEEAMAADKSDEWFAKREYQKPKLEHIQEANLT